MGDRLIVPLPEDANAALPSRGQVAVEADLNGNPFSTATKNADTRARRVEVTISKLRDGKRRPCCFDLASCTDPELFRSGKLVQAP
ncbi:hypothetical protein CGZ92_08300 [Parenemella sanctibonifatiensis]|uniref:Uncharacterized protein n=1 Tax=Parenemella sanctibonifatiensis TaxID=2016505 RepID=A0A255EAB8_9ACTN|nr:hypothetical protein CGZ92_08300 [Parenemella sanctibonifatiensis]